MIRKLTRDDRELYLELNDEFFHTPAVSHVVPREHYLVTFDEIIAGSPYVDACIIEHEGEVAGYGQLSFTYSNEVAGLVVWIEELYIRPQFQRRGLGLAFFDWLHETYGGKAARFRLEIEPDNDDARKLYERLGFRDIGYESMILDFN